MDITDLRALYHAELQEAYSFEDQVAEALPRLAASAANENLREYLKEDLVETETHAEIVSGLLDGHGVEAGAHRDRAMQKILAEAEKWARMIDDRTLRDAALIASVQRVQHYEIAVYGSLAAWAAELGLDEEETLISIAEEEKAADARLTKLARRRVNNRAAA